MTAVTAAAWNIEPNPLGCLALSALLAALPILCLFWTLACRRWKGHWAALLATALAVLAAVAGYGMPVRLALGAVLSGGLFGLFPICWIVITALLIYNLSVATGQFAVIKDSLAAISADRRMQALLIAFAFGAFIEGAAGFGPPVAITGAMLAGLGFEPLYAAGLCLVANTAPVAFGAIGVPIIVGARVSGVDEMALSQMVGRTLPLLSVLVPLYLVILMAGWRKGLAVWPACAFTGGSFALVQFWSSNFLGPMLPDILASLASLVTLVVFLRFWSPRENWRFPGEGADPRGDPPRHPGGLVFRAWAPYLLLSICVAGWGIRPVSAALDHLLSFRWPVPGLHEAISRNGESLPAIFNFNLLSSAGSAILLAWLLSIPVMGASARTAGKVAAATLRQLRAPISTITLIMGFAYLMNFSGMAVTLGLAFAATGVLFPFFAAFLGWLGTFMTGSDTSSNALFGKLQEVTAQRLGVDPVITVAANTSGGVCGKMISPQSISVATAATRLVGREADIFRFTLKHSILFAGFVGTLSLLYAYAVPWIVPGWVKPAAHPGGAAPAAAAGGPAGVACLVGTIALAALVAVLARLAGPAAKPREPVRQGDRRPPTVD